jgi:hypothetical protein
MSGEERDQWLSEALATRDLERVQPNMGAAGDRINDARHHVRSARMLASDRAVAEYGDFATRQLDADHIRTAADAAERIVNALATSLATSAKRA